MDTRKFVNPPEHLSQCPVEHDGSEQLIRFLCEPGVINSIPHPVKAGEMLPRWYKQLPAIIADQKPTEGNVTVKGCFPFVDAIALAAERGVRAIIQPGGSVRDEMAIEIADRHHLAMVFTGRRHFRH